MHLGGTLLFTNCIALSIQYFFIVAELKLGYDTWTNSQKTLFVMIAIIGGTVLGLAFASSVMEVITGGEFRSLKNALSMLPITVVIAAVITLLFFGYYRLKTQIEAEVMENVRLKQLQSRTEIMALQSKMNPHFLFNTLNTMANLVYESPDKVERMILGLSGIYRMILKLPVAEKIRLADEVDLINEYLQIEQIRLGSRLSFELNMPAELGERKIPPMLIEPLVENAVIHGIGPLPAGGNIRLEIYHKGQDLFVMVEDNGVGFDPTCKRTGFGLYSIQERLRHFAGGATRIEKPPGGGTRVTLELPDEY